MNRIKNKIKGKSFFKRNKISIFAAIGISIATIGASIGVYMFNLNEKKAELKYQINKEISSSDAVLAKELFNLPVSDITKRSSNIPKPSNGSSSLGLRYIFTSWEPIDEKGEIHWDVHLEIPFGTSRDISGVIKGYHRFFHFDSENDLVNTIKGIENIIILTKGDEVQIGEEDSHIIDQKYLMSEKLKNSYKGFFSLPEKEIEFLSCVNKVKEGQFKDEVNLEVISMPQVKEIGPRAFENSPLKVLRLPKVKIIGDNTFDNNGAFKKIINDPKTTVLLPSDMDTKGANFNSEKYKNYLFGEDNWNKITFSWK